MANIALDIKANTSKALGEFKKLSRELDNKFLVQGLKLDVVKNAFRQINKEFEQSLGNQGFKTSETTNQLQRNAAANLAILNKMSFEAASQVTRDVKKNLQGLQAEAKITGDVVKESLVAASFFDFSGSEEDVKRQFQSFANQFATVSQDLNDSFGKSGAGDFQKVLTGQASVETLYGLDFGQGGATANLLQKAIRDNYGNIDAVTGEARTRLIERILKDFQDVNTDVGKILQGSKEQAKIDDPFRFINREISSLFSPRGVFGSLREIGGTFKNLDGATVPRNILQLTADLIRTIFDKDEGLFATLAKSLGEVFGFDTENVLEPILRGIEFLTGALTSLRDFLASPQFKKFLGIFTPLANAIRGIDTSKISFDVETIKGFVGKIGETIRGLFDKASSFIKNLDTSAISDVLGTIIGELVKTIPSLLGLIFSSLSKVVGLAFDTVNKSGPGAALIYTALTAGAINFIDKIFGGPGIIGRVKNALVGSLSKLAAGLGLGRGVGFGAGRRLTPVSNAEAARGTDQQRWNKLYTYLANILRALNGQGPLEEGGEQGRERRGTRRERDRRARQLRGRRQRRDRFRSVQRGFSGVNNRFRRFGGGGVNLLRRGVDTFRPGRRAYTNPVGPLPLNSAEDWARRGRLDPMSSRGGTLYSPRLESSLRPSRFSGGFGMDKGNALNRGLIGTRSPDVASRFASRYGSRGILARGAGRAAGALGRMGGGLLGGAITIGGLAALFSGNKAAAAEINADDRIPPEEKEFYKAENQKRTREQAGKAVVGAAGGAIGAAIGSIIPGGGTVIGGIIGSIAGEILANTLPAPILEGVGKLAEDIGGWFSGVWSNISSGWNSATKAIGDFFGKEGPIQRLGRFVGGNLKGGVQNIQNFFGDEGPIQSAGRWFGELGGKIMGKIEEAWNGLIDNLTSLPLNVILAALGPIGSVFRGVLTTAKAKRDKERKDSDVNFSGGFNYIGGRNSFNEYEGFRMPDGVTFIPITGSTSLANLSGGSSRSNETTNNISITVNGSENPQEVARQVVTILDTEYSISSNQATT